MNKEVEFDKFHLPHEITVVEHSATRGRFEASPLAKGMGHTFGHVLRRLLMIGLQAPGIISVAIEDVAHEYLSIAGVKENMTNIVLNLKNGRLRKMGMKPHQQILIKKEISITKADLEASGGFVKVTFGDLVDQSEFEVVNPGLEIFTVTAPFKRLFQFRVASGRGYVPSERHVVENRLINEILIDTAFSPVNLVTYAVEAARVGSDTDLDKLILTINTDGRITPEEALSLAAQVAKMHLNVFDKDNIRIITHDDDEDDTDKSYEELIQKVAKPIDDLELSVRASNCLTAPQPASVTGSYKFKPIKHIYELILLDHNDLLHLRNFGKKSSTEIKQKFEQYGLQFNFHEVLVKKYGVTPERFIADVKARIAETSGVAPSEDDEE